VAVGVDVIVGVGLGVCVSVLEGVALGVTNTFGEGVIVYSTGGVVVCVDVGVEVGAGAVVV
jgi:hypothetical protein